MFIILMLIITAIAAYYGYALLNHAWPFTGIDLNQTGVFGDSWGAFTSIFSALGFCGVLWTINLQKKATEKIEEDARKREESEKIRDFENSFFNILSVLQTIINDMRVVNKRREVLAEGRSIFLYYFKSFKQDIKDNDLLTTFFEKNSYTDTYLARKNLLYIYKSYFSLRTQNLSHYFRYLYNAFKFIDESSIDDDFKKKYANILRAQLSDYELIILFYNSLTKNGYKFQKYFSSYAVLDNLPIEKLLSKHQVVFVNKKCWGGNKLAINEYN